MVAVTTPVEGFTGTIAGVSFANGVGEADDENTLAYFTRHGYGIGAQDESESETVPEVFDPAQHNMDEVNEHLEHADDAERERVLQAESEGKARQGILTGPHSDLSGQ